MDHSRALENNKPLVVDTWVVKSLFGRVMVVWLLGALPRESTAIDRGVNCACVQALASGARLKRLLSRAMTEKGRLTDCTSIVIELIVDL
jgi:hypothetical protein